MILEWKEDHEDDDVDDDVKGSRVNKKGNEDENDVNVRSWL